PSRFVGITVVLAIGTPRFASGFQKKALSSARSEPTRLAAGLAEIVHDFDLAREHRVRNEVGDLVAGVDHRGRVAQVFHQHSDFAAISGVNHAAGYSQAARRHRRLVAQQGPHPLALSGCALNGDSRRHHGMAVRPEGDGLSGVDVIAQVFAGMRHGRRFGLRSEQLDPQHCLASALGLRTTLPPCTSTSQTGTNRSASVYAIYSCCKRRAAKVWSSPSSSTGTVFCRMIGPRSRCSSTKWTVHPETFTPRSTACFCASSPGKAGSKEGWIFRMRFRKARTNSGESKRMYPARHTKSTPASLSAATTSASCSSRTRPLEGISRVLNPRCRADSRPGASPRLEITTAISALRRPAWMESAMASKFEPRPESRMPSFLSSVMG